MAPATSPAHVAASSSQQGHVAASPSRDRWQSVGSSRDVAWPLTGGEFLRSFLSGTWGQEAGDNFRVPKDGDTGDDVTDSSSVLDAADGVGGDFTLGTKLYSLKDHRAPLDASKSYSSFAASSPSFPSQFLCITVCLPDGTHAKYEEHQGYSDSPVTVATVLSDFPGFDLGLVQGWAHPPLQDTWRLKSGRTYYLQPRGDQTVPCQVAASDSTGGTICGHAALGVCASDPTPHSLWQDYYDECEGALDLEHGHEAHGHRARQGMGLGRSGHDGACQGMGLVLGKKVEGGSGPGGDSSAGRPLQPEVSQDADPLSGAGFKTQPEPVNRPVGGVGRSQSLKDGERQSGARRPAFMRAVSLPDGREGASVLGRAERWLLEGAQMMSVSPSRWLKGHFSGDQSQVMSVSPRWLKGQATGGRKPKGGSLRPKMGERPAGAPCEGQQQGKQKQQRRQSKAKKTQGKRKEKLTLTVSEGLEVQAEGLPARVEKPSQGRRAQQGGMQRRRAQQGGMQGRRAQQGGMQGRVQSEQCPPSMAQGFPGEEPQQGPHAPSTCLEQVLCEPETSCFRLKQGPWKLGRRRVKTKTKSNSKSKSNSKKIAKVKHQKGPGSEPEVTGENLPAAPPPSGAPCQHHSSASRQPGDCTVDLKAGGCALAAFLNPCPSADSCVKLAQAGTVKDSCPSADADACVNNSKRWSILLQRALSEEDAGGFSLPGSPAAPSLRVSPALRTVPSLCTVPRLQPVGERGEFQGHPRGPGLVAQSLPAMKLPSVEDPPELAAGFDPVKAQPKFGCAGFEPGGVLGGAPAARGGGLSAQAPRMVGSLSTGQRSRLGVGSPPPESQEGGGVEGGLRAVIPPSKQTRSTSLKEQLGHKRRTASITLGLPGPLSPFWPKSSSLTSGTRAGHL